MVNYLKPRKALNKAFLKVKPIRSEMEHFKGNLTRLLDHIVESESEEFHKNLVSDFLKHSGFAPDYFINTKGRNDLVIHNGKKSDSPAGVLIEAKHPRNRGEMISRDKLNVKALHEILLYFLRERITHQNHKVKHIVVTNIYEWFIFDSHVFEQAFVKNKSLVKSFKEFEVGRLSGTTTDFFYREIAQPAVEAAAAELEFTWFDFRDYEKALRNTDKADDRKLIALFKLLSPEHLLKLPFTNDSNSLDKKFYAELLHLIGLTQTEQKGKKLIERKPVKDRNRGSLLENAITQIEAVGVSRHLNRAQYGDTHDEQVFNIGLELVITWVNRILFLKLLEAQLLRYHHNDSEYAFLHIKRIGDYDQLNKLFFQVLARIPEERSEEVRKAFEKVPYLNSSLFDPTLLEQDQLFVSQLEDGRTLPLLSNTVLKDRKGKRRSGELNALEYIFDFLNAYDFSSEGSEDIQEDNKSLINASVLGLIFEKINGYKDGSFFTPGFITMYMCRETIRRAVIQKFNEAKGWDCSDLVQLYNRLDSTEYQSDNAIFNSIRICDPAVGSGHFLVSALNELITVKHELGLLRDAEGRKLRDYRIEIDNDELSITDEEGRFFEYRPHSPESHRVQKTLFHEKQALIENCLFGVDINPNSVKICRLRLWIELLKNAYYISPNSNSRTNLTTSTDNSSPATGRWPQAGGADSSSRRPQAAESTHDHRRPTAGGPISSSPGMGRWPKAGGALNNLPHLKTFRKQLRKNLTPAEATLWTLLKGKQLDGRKFRRQHSFANYILDFYCPEERLAIELDGQGHFTATQADYDYERDLFLQEFGIRVLRFENKWVWDNPEGLLEQVREWFGKQPELEPEQEPPRPADTATPASDHLHPSPPDTPPLKGGEPEPGPEPVPGPDRQQVGSGVPQLETLPNIDINIKCGNSIVSRFALDADLKKALRKSKYNITSYRAAVQTYREARSKEVKRDMEALIAEIKSDFRTEIGENDPKQRKLDKLGAELFEKYQSQQLFSEKPTAKQKAARKKLEEKINKLAAEIEEIKSNKIYENAFEWRFEFPEVLNDDGDYEGFDVVIGNPPYIRQEELGDIKPYLKEHYATASGTADLYVYFVERGMNVLRTDGQFCYILPNKWMRAGYGENLRRFVQKERIRGIVDFGDLPVFEEATTYPCIMHLEKTTPAETFPAVEIKTLEMPNGLNAVVEAQRFDVLTGELRDEGWTLMDSRTQKLLAKIRSKGVPLKEYVDGKIFYGIKTGLNEAFVIDAETKDRLIAEDPRSAEVIKPFLAGRDIKRYKQPVSSKFLIFTRRGIDIEQYPAIKRYLEQFKEQLMPKPKGFKGTWPGRKTGTYKWYELQDAVDYFEQFDSRKIIVPAIVKNASYAYDTENHYSNDKTTIIPTDDMCLLAQLNSKVVDFYFKAIASTKQNGYFEYKPVYLSQLPIVPTDNEELSLMAAKRLEAERAGRIDEVKSLEKQIDEVVFGLFGLSEEEIEIITNPENE